MMSWQQPLRGFVHAGGVLQDAIVSNMTHARCQAVFAPKMTGLHNTESSMHCAPMDAVILFSSIASLLGGVGKANYTAANAALDASAAVQQAKGVTGSSVQWGTWIGGCMALRDPSTIKRAERVGLGVVTPEVGLGVVGAFMDSVMKGGSLTRALQVGVASPFVWSTWMSQLVDPGFFSEYAESVPAARDPVCRGAPRCKKCARAVKKRVSKSAVGVSKDNLEALRSRVMETVSAVLGHAVAQDEPLMDAGLDSLGAVELRNSLAKSAGMELPGTLVFDYPSAGALAGFLETQMASLADVEDEDDDSSEVEPRAPRRSRRMQKRSTRPGAGLAVSGQATAIRSQVLDIVSAVLGVTVGSEEPLMDAGLDSLGAVELRNGLSRSVGMDLPGTLVFDYP